MAFHVLAVHGQFSVQRNFHCGEDRLHLARLYGLELRREDRGLVLSVREHEFRHANPGPDWETESKAHRECEKNDECFLHMTPVLLGCRLFRSETTLELFPGNIAKLLVVGPSTGRNGQLHGRRHLDRGTAEAAVQDKLCGRGAYQDEPAQRTKSAG